MWKKPGCQETCAVGWRRFGRLAGPWGPSIQLRQELIPPLRCAGIFYWKETHIFLNLRGMIWSWRYLNTWWNSSSASGARFFASVQQQHQALLECGVYVSIAVPQVVEGKERPTHGYEKLKRFQFQNNWLSTAIMPPTKGDWLVFQAFFLKVLCYC